MPRSRWHWAGLGAAAVLGVAAVGSCAVSVAVAGSCGFDPPPGDHGELRVRDDGSGPVTFFDCADARCTSGSGAQQIAAGGQLTTSFELCNGDAVGVTDAAGVLRGCLVLPVGEDRPELTYRVSQFDRACAGAGTVRPRLG